jgi:hypothetical protein
VLHFAFQHVGDCLEAAVRVVGRADRMPGGIVDRPHLIDQQEGVDDAQPVGRERTANDEPAPLALLVRGDDAQNFADVLSDAFVGRSVGHASNHWFVSDVCEAPLFTHPLFPCRKTKRTASRSYND